MNPYEALLNRSIAEIRLYQRTSPNAKNIKPEKYETLICWIEKLKSLESGPEFFNELQSLAAYLSAQWRVTPDFAPSLQHLMDQSAQSRQGPQDQVA